MSVSPFQGIVGHKELFPLLEKMLSRPVTGYVFFGPAGLGKKMVAERLAREWLAHPEPLPLEAHPDFLRVTREEGAKEVSVKQARELIKQLQLTSARGGKRVALVEEAEAWNAEACNAVLKIVEEPPPGVTFLFLCSRLDALPLTLRSRLVLIRFEHVPRRELETWLEALEIKVPDIPAWIRRIRGCPGKAHSWLEDAETMRQLERDAQTLVRTIQERRLGEQLGEIERCSRLVESQENPDQAWQELFSALTQVWMDVARQSPKQAVHLGTGLIQAWRMIGGPLSPRIGLEQTLLKTPS